MCGAGGAISSSSSLSLPEEEDELGEAGGGDCPGGGTNDGICFLIFWFSPSHFLLGYFFFLLVRHAREASRAGSPQLLKSYLRTVPSRLNRDTHPTGRVQRLPQGACGGGGFFAAHQRHRRHRRAQGYKPRRRRTTQGHAATSVSVHHRVHRALHIQWAAACAATRRNLVRRARYARRTFDALGALTATAVCARKIAGRATLLLCGIRGHTQQQHSRHHHHHHHRRRLFR